MDGIWGSAGKGGVSGWLAKRHIYDTAICAYGTQAGHSYNDAERGIQMMTQQLPIAVASPFVKNVLLGPGSLIHAETLRNEIGKYLQEGQRLLIHENAAVVTDEHAEREKAIGMTKMGSTAKGVGQAMIDRLLRNPDTKPIARLGFAGTDLEKYVVDRFEYDRVLNQSRRLIVEGAQGFGLSIYHGDWPYCTSRDVTPWQIAADCGLPFTWAPLICTWVVMRTYPIRVNNRDGTSGPAYEGQKELSWEQLGKHPELTTVTKLPRRVFEFSLQQYQHAMLHCAGMENKVVLTFADYCEEDELRDILHRTLTTGARVDYLCFGPDDADIREVEVSDYS
ncbi:MAG TPA: adenylosuccinate synthetase [Fimbriimonas sp.]|nr:adenylosuccinate synthetase [Fimbriimonas sp.]